jgi:membrane-associated phospholipid phosphatase
MIMNRVGRWLGWLVGRREQRPDDERSLTLPPMRGGADDDGDTPTVVQDRPSTEPGEAAAAVEEAVVEPMREAGQRSRAPRWLAFLRTNVFIGLAATGLFLFGGLAVLVRDGMTTGVDLAVTEAVQSIAAPWFGALMLAVSWLGFLPQSVLLVVGVAALLWLADYRAEAGFAVLASASVILTETIKGLIDRPRPDADLVTVLAGASGYSFPSGHTLFYVTFFGFLAYVAYALWKPGRMRTGVLVVTISLIALVGPSRIWMGQHWASDVLASYALGLTYLIVLVHLYRRYRFKRAPEQPVSTLEPVTKPSEKH